MEAESRYRAVAARLRTGEWTSYGDIATAAGHPGRARAVGRTAATSDDFPNAHRVLRADGTIARGSDRRSRDSADRVQSVLEREGVAFSAAGRADPAARIYWDELRRRSNERAHHVSSHE